MCGDAVVLQYLREETAAAAKGRSHLLLLEKVCSARRLPASACRRSLEKVCSADRLSDSARRTNLKKVYSTHRLPASVCNKSLGKDVLDASSS